MPATKPPAPPHWLAYVGLATLVLGSVLQAGFTLARIDSLNERVTKLEAQNEQIHAIDVRTARIETKLDTRLDDLKGERRP